MPPSSEVDTIRILVATDNHVGYCERDPIRGDDSWKSFHECMCLAKEHDVDMVLLAGDLFHENKPSRKSMYQVMRSLRMNCYGDKPCELEMISDSSEAFQGTFNHANYEDPDINVGIPVFSIHGNHDDPSGEGHLAALDILQMSGLLNYYGRTPESDNIVIKPVLLQKGRTKLALYGMSNVRDERLYRTFRDGKVKFFQPNTQKENWFNLMSVHQNHHKYTETGFLPENFLPDFMDLVVWGHEHECLIDPRYNPEMNFHVIQPGSSVATSLMPGEAVPKHVAIVSITGKEFKSQSIQLKTVRPFIMKEIVLQDEPGMKSLSKKDSNRPDITRHLEAIVLQMISEAKAEWLSAQEDLVDEDIPLPLVRLRVEYTAPDGGRFDCENPQRFSNKFRGKVANDSDVVQFYRKKSGGARKAKDGTQLPEESIMAQLSLDTVKVEKLVREFLTAQSLTILPQNSFGDAVSQFVDKDDKHAMELFVESSLSNQIQHLVGVDEQDDDDLPNAMGEYRSKLEELFAAGHLKRAVSRFRDVFGVVTNTPQKRGNLKPKPAYWDSDLDGEWADQIGAVMLSDQDADDNGGGDGETGSAPAVAASKRAAATATSKQKSAASKPEATTVAKKTAASRTAKAKKIFDDDDDSDVVMIDDDSQPEATVSTRAKARLSAGPKKVAAPVRKVAAKAASSSRTPTHQTQLNFSQSTSTARPAELSADEISDDSDAFEPAPVTTRTTRGRK